MWSTKWGWLAAAMIFAMALAVPVSAQESDSVTDTFDVSVENPYVDWDGGFSGSPVDVKVNPDDFQRQYTVKRAFTVMSTTPFAITVGAAWNDDTGIEMNANNNAVTDADDTAAAFDVQISARDNAATWFAPAAGSQTLLLQPNTLANNASDNATYTAAVTLVLVDEPSALEGPWDTSGWDSGGAENRRFDALPDGDYVVDVTVTISEDL